jgi:hypothetical protein
MPAGCEVEVSHSEAVALGAAGVIVPPDWLAGLSADLARKIDLALAAASKGGRTVQPDRDMSTRHRRQGLMREVVRALKAGL